MSTRTEIDYEIELYEVPTQIPTEGNDELQQQHSAHHMGEVLEGLSQPLSGVYHPNIRRKIPDITAPTDPRAPSGVPAELPNFTAEVIMILVCSVGLVLFSFLLGDVTVNQLQLKKALGISNSDLPWLVGAFSTANGLSVVISGSLIDLTPPKCIMVGAFAWMAVWNVIGVFSIHPSRSVLFFIVRAMQGLAIGVLVSGSMSILGRVYRPGLRKNHVFSAVAATAPFGFWLGTLQGGALQAHLKWVFGSNAIVSALYCVATWFSIPDLQPVADTAGAEAPSIRQFDLLGASAAVTSCVCLLFGLTQGSVTNWSSYTYSLVIIGLVALVAFFFIECRVARPPLPARIWRIKGFTPLMIAYFLGYGSYLGAWQFYTVQSWLRIQHTTPLAVSLNHLPNAIVGVLATWVVSRTLHIVPGHYIYFASMLAFALGPVFFLPQTPNTIYWALSFPGVSLVSFGPDSVFAAASIFITSNVPRSYQGSAGSLLVTVQNLSSAIMTSIADIVGTRVDTQPDGDIGLRGLREIWWLGLAVELVGGLITLLLVRIPKEEEKDHVS
ncbi:putative efflux pump antibiotic resistance protein [Aspergillus ellipticus CBS 707.79]|uniref:Putative efflux pump antibiotic resistance protein n=1 Tax=Aspergillus ellipticus CBS 707.79 TaxID=1448320 RepID=A0A319D3Z4_9EURO|nr:putative efflux pump antibiotic resistance protein [Aspergillus ellipticus CBS 707.79]